MNPLPFTARRRQATPGAASAPLRLAAAWLTLFVVGTDLFVVSPLIPGIAREYAIPAASGGWLVGIFACSYAVAAPVFGHVADRLGRYKVLVTCLCAFAAANVLTSLARGFGEMLAARLACGVAAAGVTPSLYALLGDAAPAGRRGTWIAIGVTGLLSALPLGATAGAFAGTIVGWRLVFLAMGAAAAMLTVVNGLVWRTQQASVAIGFVPGVTDGASGLACALLPTVAWSAALYGMYTYLAVGLAASGYTAPQIAGVVCIYGVAAFFGALAGGRIADRLGPARAVRVSLVGLAVAFAVLELSLRRGEAITGAVALTSVIAQTFFPAQQARLIANFDNRRATALAWNNSALFLGMTVGSFAGGKILGAAGFIGIPVMSAVFAVLGLGMCSARFLRLPAAGRPQLAALAIRRTSAS